MDSDYSSGAARVALGVDVRLSSRKMIAGSRVDTQRNGRSGASGSFWGIQSDSVVFCIDCRLPSAILGILGKFNGRASTMQSWSVLRVSLRAAACDARFAATQDSEHEHSEARRQQASKRAPRCSHRAMSCDHAGADAAYKKRHLVSFIDLAEAHEQASPHQCPCPNALSLYSGSVDMECGIACAVPAF